MTYTVLVAPAAKRELKKLTRQVRKRVMKALAELATTPRPVGVEKLSQDPRFWRHRAGDYRFIYAVDDKQSLVQILVVRHRKDAYRDIDKLDARLVADTIAPLLLGRSGPQ
jgi:mRNA interferase RelE/StbE